MSITPLKDALTRMRVAPAIRPEELPLFKNVAPVPGVGRKVSVSAGLIPGARKANYREQALKYLDQYPRILTLFIQFALEAVAAKKKFAAMMIAQRVRWEVTVYAKDEEGFKLNNSHVPYIMRRVIELHPQVESWVEMRRVKF